MTSKTQGESQDESLIKNDNKEISKEPPRFFVGDDMTFC